MKLFSKIIIKTIWNLLEAFSLGLWPGIIVSCFDAWLTAAARPLETPGCVFGCCFTGAGVDCDDSLGFRLFDVFDFSLVRW